MATTQQSPATSPIGRDTLRIDGPRKVTGLAQYTSDFNFPGMLYAVPVEATIANGKLLTLDTSAAEKMPGARAVIADSSVAQTLDDHQALNVAVMTVFGGWGACVFDELNSFGVSKMLCCD